MTKSGTCGSRSIRARVWGSNESPLQAGLGCLTGNRVASEEVVLEAPVRVIVIHKGERAGGSKSRGCRKEIGSSASSG